MMTWTIKILTRDTKTNLMFEIRVQFHQEEPETPDLCQIPTPRSAELLRAVPAEVFQEYIFSFADPKQLVKLQYVWQDFWVTINDNVMWEIVMKNIWFKPALDKLSGVAARWPNKKDRYFHLKRMRKIIACALEQLSQKYSTSQLRQTCHLLEIPLELVPQFDLLKLFRCYLFSCGREVVGHMTGFYFDNEKKELMHTENFIFPEQILSFYHRNCSVVKGPFLMINGKPVPHGKCNIIWYGKYEVYANIPTWKAQDKQKMVTIPGALPSRFKHTKHRISCDVTFCKGVIVDEDLKDITNYFWKPSLADFQ